MITHKSTVAEIRNHFHLDAPAKGMSNLARSTQEAIKAQHKRRIKRIRLKLREGKPITNADLILE